jgi:hypothetical protein
MKSETESYRQMWDKVLEKLKSQGAPEQEYITPTSKESDREYWDKIRESNPSVDI